MKKFLIVSLFHSCSCHVFVLVLVSCVISALFNGETNSWNLWVFLAQIQTIMACGISGKSEINEGGANDSVASVGDVIFVKLRDSSWWPAQVS